MESGIWTYPEGVMATGVPVDVAGYGVEAIDGGIGKVDEATYDVGSSYLVVDTGPWIFGKKVTLPAGVVSQVDHDDRKVFVNRTQDEIRNAPELDEGMLEDERYRDDLGGYYGPGGAGWRDWSTMP